MTKKYFKSQKGVSLIIVFLMVTTMLLVVLDISTVLFKQTKIMSHIESAVSSLAAAKSGIEKTLYFDNKEIPPRATRGFCNLCDACDSGDCQSCTTVSLATDGSNGCDDVACVNCQISFKSIFGDASHIVDAKLTPNSSNPGISDLNIFSTGFYKDTKNVATYTSAQLISLNPLPTIKRIFPSSVRDGSPSITVTVNGDNFISVSVVKFNGVAKSTAFVSATRLTATIPSSDLAVEGVYPVTVTNPTPGGGTSNAKNFRVR